MTVAAIYKARWTVELFFKELKQTLQLQDFFGENQNAVEWQIWAAMLTHLDPSAPIHFLVIQI